MEILTLLSSSWQFLLIAIIAGGVLAWIAKHFLVERPKTVNMVVQVLKVLESTIKGILGAKWAPVYDAILKAGEVAIDGAVTYEEAVVVADKAFDAAIAASGAQLTDEEKKIALAGLHFLVSALFRDKAAAKVAMAQARNR